MLIPNNIQPSFFRTDRLFYHSFIGENESWYFYQRGREPAGPFKDRGEAIVAMCDHVTYHVKKGDTGGR